VVDARTLVAQRIVDGAAALVQVDIEHGTATPLATAWQRFGQPCSDGERVWFVGERHDRAAAIVEHDLRSGEERVLEGGTEPVDAAYLAAPERVAFTGDQGLTSWAWLVLTHGGPTGATSPGLNLRIQYYTSRGWAVADVDYAGSTGYGRAYRERLRERWGIADVADVVAVVDHLAARGLVDRERVAIRGGSAGGYTTLAALAFTDRFRAGVSCYGIGDLTALARDTHKFESRYLDRLIAPWPAGEPVYRARSPIEHLDGFRCPAIFLQGGKDRVVPPNQAEAMAAALRARGIPVAHVVFPDEGHGFRNGGNVRRAMALEYAFLARIFGFTPADPPEPLHIDNLDDNPGDNLDDTENRE
jgi:dipeptidyl aminopeptidase/acylaminoacyl peptidase